MKIRSAISEDGCLIFTHYRVANEKKTKKTSEKHIRIRALQRGARMRKKVINIAKNLATVDTVNEQFHQVFSTEIAYVTWIGI